MTSNLAIIPARGGSKRIPRKNIRDFQDRPIIAYSIIAALESRLFDKVMVSTDDEEIAEVAGKYGAEVPFMRSDEKADDHTVLADVIFEVVHCYEQRNILFENICCILPTAPLITSTKIKQAYDLLISSGCTSVCPVVEFSYPIWRSLKLNENERLEMNWPENLNKRSQDLPRTYHDAGVFYWINSKKFLEEKKIFTSDTRALILESNDVQDIDTLQDWQMAEIKYKLFKLHD